jgi:hypothetical protein
MVRSRPAGLWVEDFGRVVGFDARVRPARDRALEAGAEDFEPLVLDFLGAGRAADRLAAPRRCFGMQSWPASLAPEQ